MKIPPPPAGIDARQTCRACGARFVLNPKGPAVQCCAACTRKASDGAAARLRAAGLL